MPAPPFCHRQTAQKWAYRSGSASGAAQAPPPGTPPHSARPHTHSSALEQPPRHARQRACPKRAPPRLRRHYPCTPRILPSAASARRPSAARALVTFPRPLPGPARPHLITSASRRHLLLRAGLGRSILLPWVWFGDGASLFGFAKRTSLCCSYSSSCRGRKGVLGLS